MPTTIETHERLATLEAGVQYGNERLDEVKEMLERHIAKDGDNLVEVCRLQDSVKIYKRITWTTFSGLCVSAIGVLFKP